MAPLDRTPDPAELQARLMRMVEETRKFVSEQHKLDADARKLDRERLYAPFLAAAAVGGAVAGIVATIGRLL